MKRLAALRVARRSPLAARRSPLPGVILASLLSACQTTPSPGSDIRAQVHAVQLTRQALERGAQYGDLHAALRAGATAADAAAQRLVLATCGLPDPGHVGSARLYTVTTVLSTGVALQQDAVLQLRVDGDPFSSSRREGRFPTVHGHFKAVAPAGRRLDENTGVPWRLKPGDILELQVRCWPVGGEPGLVQVAYFRSASDSELHFATAEAACHALFGDAELSRGRAVRACCRAGVDEGSRQGSPVGQVLTREDRAPASARQTDVDCS